MDMDDVLAEIGEWGRYQKLVVWLILLPGVLPCGFHAYDQLFMAAVPPHWCRVPELDPWVQNHMNHVINISIPFENKDGTWKPNECNVYVRNYSTLSKLSGLQQFINVPFDTPTKFCDHGWHFDRSDYISTVVTEWNLVCDKKFYLTLALMLFGVGGLVGNYIFGYVQDSLGRRPAFFIYLAIQCFFGIATAFARDYTTWLIFRIGVGFTVPAILGTPYVLAIELVGTKKRTLCTILINIAYSLALILLAILVWAIRDWRLLALSTTLPFVSFFLFWWALPESPRWLLARGKFQEADKIFRKIARMNKTRLPPNYLTLLKRKYDSDRLLSKKSDTQHYGVLDLFKTPNLCQKTLIITFIWFTNTSVYVGLSYYAPALGGDEFLNFFLAGAVELPTYIFLWPAMDWIGRRWTLCASMIIGGVACLATFLVKNDSEITLALYCIGKMGISSSFVVLPLMASELYPTVVRGLGMSMSSVLGMLGPIFIPLVNYLGGEMLILPLLIMGVLLIAGGISSLLLPETLGQTLPQSLADGEKIGIGCMNLCNTRDQKEENKLKMKSEETAV
ncbi:beta-alanine transporter [Chrysoperla carnea]|uniref:beta-alanine transporter n=1 Tax=Chrysoperla carnea TaxID=189513 RepID=UPI001D094D75|nr:beta-alanine transporter [Chrysoperla carnea]